MSVNWTPGDPQRKARKPVDWWAFLIGGLIVLAILVIPWVVSSAFEARAYNNATGMHVSTWDAMFLDLRVMAEPKP